MQNQFIKDYLTFNSSERRGIIILMAFILLTLSLRLILPGLLYQSHHQAKTSDAEVKQWLGTLTEDAMSQLHTENREAKESVHFSLFDFDPNVVSSEEIENLGISNDVRRVWINYLAKGGKFYRKEELKKIYGLDSITYNRLEPYIFIKNERSRPFGSDRLIDKNESPIEINTATRAEFERLKGIGPVLAERICKYRNLLGGFYSVSQLSEVFGITDSLVKVNENLMSLNKSMIEKININQADFRTLSGHPYISDYEANAIIHYREWKGFIESLNELAINNLIRDSALTKLTDYLILKEL